MKIYYLLFGFLFLGSTLTGFSQQVGVNTNNPHPSAALEVQSTSGGLLIPRMTNEQMKLIANPAAGLMVFNTDSSAYYLFERGSWTALPSQSRFVGKRSVNGAAFTDYTIDRKRYIWELNGSFAQRNSIPIPDSVLLPLCGDEDGCRIQLQMANFNGANDPPAIMTGFFFINPVTRAWRFSDGNVSSGFNTGTDGNNVIEHAAVFFTNVYFTDGAYSNGVGSDAAGNGMQLMKWNTYPVSTICRLILED